MYVCMPIYKFCHTFAISDVIKEADNLYDENKFEALHDVLLPHKDSKEPEILWRLARAIFEKCRSMEQKEKLNALEEALALVGEALRIDENCWAAHKVSLPKVILWKKINSVLHVVSLSWKLF